MTLKSGNINVSDRDVNKISDSNIPVQKMVLNIFVPAKIMKMLCVTLPKMNRYDKNFGNVNPKTAGERQFDPPRAVWFFKKCIF